MASARPATTAKHQALIRAKAPCFVCGQANRPARPSRHQVARCSARGTAAQVFNVSVQQLRILVFTSVGASSDPAAAHHHASEAGQALDCGTAALHPPLPIVVAMLVLLPRTQETATPNPDPNLNPGDDAAPGTPGTGEDVCPTCHGSGRKDADACATCGGSGKVIRAIGGA